MKNSQAYLSGDSHLEIPCDRWTHRVPAPYRDRAPRRVRLPGGGDGFVGEGSPLIFGGTGHYAGHTPESFDPMVAVDMDTAAGSGPPEQRLREQDVDGVGAEVLFPSNTAMKLCRSIGDRDTYRAVIRAYNDYLAEEYCAMAPDRLIGVGVLPHRGLDDDIAELTHCTEIGIKIAVRGRYPSGKGYPTAEDDRFWAAALDLGMPVCIHNRIAPGRGPLFNYPRQPTGEVPPDDFVQRLYRHGHQHGGCLEACQMVLDGLFDRFPTLRIYWAENQIGWIPFYYEQMDLEYERNCFWAERHYGLPRLERKPSEYLREHAYWGFFNDPIGLRLRHDIGMDRIIWGNDFPHVVSPWPQSQQVIGEQLAGATDGEKERITRQNLLDFLQQSP